MNNLDKSVISYLNTVTDLYDIDLTIEEHYNSKYMIIRVDVPKVDKNTPNYDSNYVRKITNENKRRSHPIPGLISRTSYIKTLIYLAKNFFGESVINYSPAFLPKNHEYLDDIENKINYAAKKVDERIEFKIDWDSDFERPIITLYGNGLRSGKDLIDDTQKELGDEIKIDSYRVQFTNSPKPKKY